MLLKCQLIYFSGGKDAPSYETSAHFIEHLGSVDKELNGLKDSHHLMTHGEGRRFLEEMLFAFSML